MDRTEWVKTLFDSIDRQDNDAFQAFLADEIVFRFGNAESVNGKLAAGDLVKGFLESIKAISHDVLESWVEGNTVICHGRVTYTRHDSSTLTVPFANILKTNGRLISEYLIFVDVSELYKTA
ncbi:MAG: nuclear transport factor 2 family protein [Candidatus Marinimicrobia bacterium]|nr:nuclear transport factor 2 family protein [Candidatus Neomarinimicrobiota bacterium]